MYTKEASEYFQTPPLNMSIILHQLIVLTNV